MAVRPPVRFEVEDGIAMLTLDRPERRNAADGAMVRCLADCLDRAEAEGAAALLLTGAGEAFCAGWDFGDIARLSELDEEYLVRAFEENEDALDRLRRSPLPTIALVNGPASGFGVSLVARCDFALAADHAHFHLPEAALGLVPAAVAQDMLRIAGPRLAFDWLALADRRDAEAARAAGLVRDIVPASALVARGRVLARRLAETPEGVLAELKQLLTTLDVAVPWERHALAVAGAARAVRSPAARALIEEMRTKKIN